jgi:hypothetical protein
MDLLEGAKALRQTAWLELTKCKPFASFKAMDDAVAAMGGGRLIGESPLFGAANMAEPNPPARKRIRPFTPKKMTAKRSTQGDVAEKILRDGNQPLNIHKLLAAVIDEGVEINGTDKLSNFRSNISRDKRFRSIMSNGGYFWWITSSPIPRGWDETAGQDLWSEPAVSSDNQEGGDGHGPATT